MFRRIAERCDLSLVRDDDEDAPLFTLTTKDGAGDPVTLGLQNTDELTFSVGEFWASFFPYETVQGLFEKAVLGWFGGQTRLACHWRGRKLVRIDMQVRLKHGAWRRIYTEYLTWRLPILSFRTTYRTHTAPDPSL